MAQPVPFTIVRPEGAPPVASNGMLRLTCLDPAGQVRLRRAIRTSTAAPMAERVLPHLNQLAGELVADIAMPAHEVASRLHVLQAACRPVEQQNVEWAFVELNGVFVYTDGVDVIVTTQDMRI